MRVLALVLLLAAACGKSGEGERANEEPAVRAAPAPETAPADPEPAAAIPGPAVPTGEEQATAEKAAEVLDDLGKIAENARGNCDKAAAAMKGVIDRNRAVLSAAARLGQDESKEQWLAEKFGPRTDAAKSKLMPLMEKCAEHEGIATVFDSIE